MGPKREHIYWPLQDFYNLGEAIVMQVKIIPITDKYREGYGMIKWRCKKGKGKKRGR
jgi:hypothetical protein